jgi:CspA family cold shock protein
MPQAQGSTSGYPPVPGPEPVVRDPHLIGTGAQSRIGQTEAVDAIGGGRPDESGREQEGTLARGVVKFYRAEKGWGGIESEMTPDDVWFHFSDIEGAGYRSLDAGEPVEFRWVPAQQDSWNCRATWVRSLTGK